MAEPTAALTYQDLIIAVAEQLGVAYYGAAGDEAAQVPTDAYELDRVKRFVQDGIRMFIADSPPAGWRWQRPLASIVLWATATGTASGAPTYVDPSSTVTSHLRMFYDSMVGHNLAFTVTSTADGTPSYDSTDGVTTIDVDDAIFSSVVAVGQSITFSATSNAYIITQISDTTTVVVEGDASGEADGDTVTIARNYAIASVTSAVVAVVTGDASGEADDAAMTVTADGAYIMPGSFGGEVVGGITYTAGSNIGTTIDWGDELEIRRLRENWNDTRTRPYLAAIRRNQTNSRQWDLLVYPTPGSDQTVEFPYMIYFDEITELTDMHVAGFAHDETVKWAAKSQAEMQGEDAMAGATEYYRKIALLNSFKTDARAAPRKLGYCGNPGNGNVSLRDFRQFTRRPTVTYN